MENLMKRTFIGTIEDRLDGVVEVDTFCGLVRIIATQKADDLHGEEEEVILELTPKKARDLMDAISKAQTIAAREAK